MNESTLEAAGSETPSILIVDDDASVRDVISVLLKEEGYLTTTVESAELALAFLDKEEVQLVISDMKMPGKDGLWLLDNLRRKFAARSAPTKAPPPPW